MQRRPIRTYRDLDDWQLAVDLVVAVHRLVRRIPVPERYDFAGQMRGAARSVSANIAEGFGRDHLGDYLRSLAAARGSLFEVESDLYVLRALALVGDAELETPLSLTDRIGRMLTNHAKSLRKGSNGPRRPKTFFDDDA